MPKIQVLSETLASQVAAGEVVERPASVVKELVENSLDAGATHIQVEIQRGGVALVKVTDNGCGMSKDDLLLSLERHATSKLKSSEQLMHIQTMGFRGEAVPSIASVSQFRMASQETGAIEGTEVIVTGGKVTNVKSTGMSDGTVVEVKQLFYNVPARRKFLRTEGTEAAHVEHQVRLHALSAPNVRFTFRKDGREVIDLPATDDWRMRIIGISGKSITSALKEVPHYERAGMEISGFILPSEFSRKGKRQQFVFLNGRPVEDSAISRALRDAYRGAVGEGLNPSAWLKLEMHPARVDVNVHPAKKEVRFQRPHDVRYLITEAVEYALKTEREVSDQAKIVSRMEGTSEPVRSLAALNRQPLDESVAKPAEWQQKEKAPEETNRQLDSVSSPVFPIPQQVLGHSELQQEMPSVEKTKRPEFELLAVLHQTYILMQNADGLVILDPKAARQRILYEQITKAAGSVPTQGLLIPEVIELDAFDADVVSRNLDHFNDCGITMEAFGTATFQVSALPEFVEVKEPRNFIEQLIDELVATQETKKGKTVAYDLFAKNVSLKVARNERPDVRTVDGLLDELFSCDLPYCDSEGEPTLVQISLSELARKFGKKK